MNNILTGLCLANLVLDFLAIKSGCAIITGDEVKTQTSLKTFLWAVIFSFITGVIISIWVIILFLVN